MQQRSLWPVTTVFRPRGIEIDRNDLTRLADRFGTPLYVFDAATIRNALAAYQRGLATYPAATHLSYAGKALLNSAIARLVAEQADGIDAVSLGELAIARQAGVAAERLHLHGNATPTAELDLALAWGVGRIVIDNADQLATVAALAALHGVRQPIWLRVAPDIVAGGHAHIQTGAAVSKFGLPIADGSAGRAIAAALSTPSLALVGLHVHVGSQIRDFAALTAAADKLLALAVAARVQFGWTPAEICVGGGLAVATHPDETHGDIAHGDVAAYCAALVEAIVAGCARHALPLPRLACEPGRSIVARAGVAIYTVTGRKPLGSSAPDYLHIDGGMGDNPRPALYSARYTAHLLHRPLGTPTRDYQIAGRYCESGDRLIERVALPAVEPGDRLAVPVSGAYTLSMASNYNGVGRPAVLLLDRGNVRLIQRRETWQDLLHRDAAPEAP